MNWVVGSFLPLTFIYMNIHPIPHTSTGVGPPSTPILVYHFSTTLIIYVLNNTYKAYSGNVRHEQILEVFKTPFCIGEPFKEIKLWAKIPPRMRYCLWSIFQQNIVFSYWLSHGNIEIAEAKQAMFYSS